MFVSGESLAKRVLGITDPSNHDLAWAEAYETLVGRPYQDGDLEQLPSEIAVDEQAPDERAGSLSRTQMERHQAMAEIESIVEEGRVASVNSLVDWPIYKWAMYEHGTEAKGPAKALMIGALTALSARAFVCLANDVYGADTAIVVDPEYGEDKLKHGLFVCASGLELPFKDNSIDFVHTNQLLHMLVDPLARRTSRSDMIRQLSREIARVLAPGGQLFMKEIVPDYRDLWVEEKGDYDGRRAERQRQAVTASIAHMLGSHGVRHVRVLDTPSIKGHEFLFDTSRDPMEYLDMHNPSPLLFTIYARK